MKKLAGKADSGYRVAKVCNGWSHFFFHRTDCSRRRQWQGGLRRGKREVPQAIQKAWKLLDANMISVKLDGPLCSICESTHGASNIYMQHASYGTGVILAAPCDLFWSLLCS